MYLVVQQHPAGKFKENSQCNIKQVLITELIKLNFMTFLFANCYVGASEVEKGQANKLDATRVNFSLWRRIPEC